VAEPPVVQGVHVLGWGWWCPLHGGRDGCAEVGLSGGHRPTCCRECSADWRSGRASTWHRVNDVMWGGLGRRFRSESSEPTRNYGYNIQIVLHYRYVPKSSRSLQGLGRDLPPRRTERRQDRLNRETSWREQFAVHWRVASTSPADTSGRSRGAYPGSRNYWAAPVAQRQRPPP
jgi:hypothetical protein